MKQITKINPVINTCPEELKDLADSLRNIANEIENGEVLAFAWCAINNNDKFEIDWVKARGISKLSLIGSISALLHEINTDTLKD